ncbi:auxin-induced protein 6B-like [Diospyros lotus]|uniref:auxin-induced protein 6B-like n=1 Tax=Diospyros lotus TaxID=55363 RepID=UPI00224F3B11|nr:auxin-induced protein 6B-like [Diospyros lotus]
MSPFTGKSNKIGHIVRVRQMLLRWRKKAAAAAGRVPADVPAGHVAICVGSECRRFVVRASYLNHPVFRRVLAQAEEEYGFANQGPLALPCDESLFLEILRVVSRAKTNSDFQRCSHVDRLGVPAESRPLVRGFPDKSVY